VYKLIMKENSNVYKSWHVTLRLTVTDRDSYLQLRADQYRHRSED